LTIGEVPESAMGNNAAAREALIPEDSGGVPADQSGTSLPVAHGDRPQIIYALIARSAGADGQLPKEVLCDYSALNNNAEAQIRACLQKFSEENCLKSFVYGEKHGLHYMSEDSLWFVCLADKAYGNDRPFLCLKALQDALKQQNPSGAVAALSSFSSFREEMKRIVTHWNSESAGNERLQRMTQSVKDIHENLLDSIDHLMERGEKIDVLVSRSQILSESSDSFRRETRVLTNRIRWRNIKSYIILGLLVLAVIFIIILMSCGGFSFKDC
jgi:vesicle-associated membrane protein 7